ncbi:MAG: sugar phosphate isomerase/epimerase family protein [Planctomycetaceae bacterium]
MIAVAVPLFPQPKQPIRMKPRIAVAADSIKLPLRKVIPLAPEMDADGLQLVLGSDVNVAEMTESARRQLLRELGERGLRIAALFVPVDRGLAEFAGLDARLDRIKQGMMLSFQLKAAATTFRIGRIPGETASDEYETLVAVLNDLARYANHVGALPAMTIFGDAAEDVARLVGRIVEGPIGISLDPSLVAVSGHSPVDAFRTLFPSVNEIVVRDAVRDMDGTVHEVPVGRGEVPWDEFLSQTSEAEFNGWFVVKRTQGDDKAGDMARAIRFVRNVRPQ